METLNEVLSYGGMTVLFAVTIISLLIFLRSIRSDMNKLKESREQNERERQKILEHFPESAASPSKKELVRPL